MGPPTKLPAMVAAGGGEDPKEPSDKDEESEEGDDKEKDWLRRHAGVRRKKQEEVESSQTSGAATRWRPSTTTSKRSTSSAELARVWKNEWSARADPGWEQACWADGHNENIMLPSTALEKFWTKPVATVSSASLMTMGGVPVQKECWTSLNIHQDDSDVDMSD